jgi:hypothetical protein
MSKVLFSDEAHISHVRGCKESQDTLLRDGIAKDVPSTAITCSLIIHFYCTTHTISV